MPEHIMEATGTIESALANSVNLSIAGSHRIALFMGTSYICVVLNPGCGSHRNIIFLLEGELTGQFDQETDGGFYWKGPT